MSDLVLSVKHSSDSAATSTHFHDCNQLLFVKSGAACVTVNGERFNAHAGSLVITNRFERQDVYKRQTERSSDTKPPWASKYIKHTVKTAQRNTVHWKQAASFNMLRCV